MKKILCHGNGAGAGQPAGCGLKGPLYFPPQDKPKQTTPQPPVEQTTLSSTATQPDGQQENNLTSPDTATQATQ